MYCALNEMLLNWGGGGGGRIEYVLAESHTLTQTDRQTDGETTQADRQSRQTEQVARSFARKSAAVDHSIASGSSALAARHVCSCNKKLKKKKTDSLIAPEMAPLIFARRFNAN